jgi:uncharacterized membrane protein YfcA
MFATTLIILVVAAVVTSTISAILGMAGGILLQVVMLMQLPLLTVVPLHGAIQLCSNGTRLGVYFRDMERRIVGRFAIGALFGGVVGWMFLNRVAPEPNSPTERVLEAILGLVILGTTFLPTPKLKHGIGNNLYVLVGVGAACIGILLGAVGPFIAPFFIREGMVKERLIATKAACQLLCHVVKIPTFIAWGFDFVPYTWFLLAMFGAVVLGTLIGRRLLKYVSPRAFTIAVKVLLALAALKLVTGFKLPGA